MKHRILLIGRKDDPHIQSISKELYKMNAHFVLLDNLSLHDNFSLKFNKGTEYGIIKLPKDVIYTDQIKSVWNSSPLRISINKNLMREAYDFVYSEWVEGISSLWNFIESKWINHPLAIYNSLNRIRQLQLANEVGMRTPKTLITNDANAFLKFFKECDNNIIAKTLHSSKGLPKGKMIFTTKIMEDDLKYMNDLQYAPCMFQEYVPKKTEFRVTIIGDNLHSAQIHSQLSKKTMHDWRNYDDFKKTPYVRTTLPNQTSQKLLELMRTMGLEFGGIDLIETPSGEFFFLEVNPNGRWWWIQKLTGMNIAKDIAEQLNINN